MIYADGKLVATNVETVTGAGNVKAATTRYMHYDPLGSIDMITVPRGEVVDRLSYDPFGARRPGDWKADGIVTLETFSNRGFTGHEHIDEIGLIHMNGRVYDAELGRFLSADRYVQAPYNTQSFNRYSYVINGPLKYTDPSGWLFDANGNYYSSTSPETNTHNYYNGGNQSGWKDNDGYSSTSGLSKTGVAKVEAERQLREVMAGGSGNYIGADTAMPEKNQTFVFIGFNGATLYSVHKKHHTFVITLDPYKKGMYITIGGPTLRVTNLLNTALSVSAKLSSIGQPSSLTKKVVKNTFGPIKTGYGYWNEQRPKDKPSTTFDIQYIGSIEESHAEVISKQIEFSDSINRKNITYNPIGKNSNSYSFSALENLVFERPRPLYASPGWDEKL